MDKFTAPKIQGELKPGEADIRVVKLDQDAKPVQEFQFQKITKAGDGDYHAVKARYGALAATDADRAARTRKDARFHLSPLLRDPLSVEEEERRVIDGKVRARVAEMEEQAKRQAAELGHQEGLKKGHEEAFQKFREEGSERIQRFDAFLKECEAAKAEIFRANERFLIELIFRISRTVLLKELNQDRDFVLRLTKDLLEKVGVRENIKIRVSPRDLETAGLLREGLEKSLGGLKNLEIEASNQIKIGGCAIETEWNAIDASIETQLQGLYEALVGKTKGVDAENKA